MDAAYKAIDSLVRVDAELLDYSVSSVTEGIEALATTRVIIRPAGKLAGEGFVTTPQGSAKVQRSFSGNGADEDIVVSSVRAYVSALNKMIGWMSVANRGAQGTGVASMDGGSSRKPRESRGVALAS